MADSEGVRVESCDPLSDLVFENARNGLVLLNREGVIVKANPAFERYLGYPRAELESGMTLRDFVPDEAQRIELDKRRRARISGEKVLDEYETQMSTKSGEVRDFMYSVGMETIKGNIIVDLHDITDKKRLEAERTNLESLIRHDMGNLLQAIDGASQGLQWVEKLYAQGKLDVSQFHEKVATYNGIIVRNTRSLREIFLESREYGLIQTEVYNISPQNMYSLVESALLSSSKQLEEANVKVTNAIPVGLECSCDPVKMGRVWSNYVTNAGKYSRGKDYDNTLEIGCAEKDDFYEFYVKDNGIGIDPSDIKKLDIPYTRLRVNNVPGTGLGLASIREIVKKHGGATRIESEGKDRGATFYFTLPIHHAASQ
jgi:PAS domain S-box-containing protein